MSLENASEKFKLFLENIGPKKINFEEKIQGLPAFNSLVALLHYRIRVTHIFYLVVLSIFLLWNLYSTYINSDLRDHIKRPTEAFIVPSFIPNVMRVRANSINDSQVFEYATYMAGCLGSFNYENVESQFEGCSKYMGTKLKAEFRAKNRVRIPLWKERKVDQYFVFDIPKKFIRKTTSKNGTIFVIEIWGKVKKYMEGRELNPYMERITLKIKTTKWMAGRPFLFETFDLGRITKEEVEDEKMHKKMKRIEKNNSKGDK